MIVLTNTTDKIQVALSANVSTQYSCYASYRDTTSNSITPGRTFSSTNNTTPVDIVSSPLSSTQRIIDYLSVYNEETTTATVSIYFNDNNTLYELVVCSLSSGDKIEYVDGKGFKTFDTQGAIKKSNAGEYNPITQGWSFSTLNVDVVNSNAVTNSIADVTGLSFSVTATKNYWFQFLIPYTSAASSTGCRFSISGPTISALYYQSRYSLTTTTFTINNGLSAFDTPSAANTGTPTTLVGMATVEGIGSFSSDGYLTARFASEVANSAITAKAGSIVYYKQLN